MKEFTPLLPNSQQIILHRNAQDFQVWEIQIFKSLLTLNSSKSTGPDAISGWVVKENADIFAPFPLQKLKISRIAKEVSHNLGNTQMLYQFRKKNQYAMLTATFGPFPLVRLCRKSWRAILLIIL